MAISGAHLTSGGDATDASSYATASISPGANRLVLAVIETSKLAGTAPLPSLAGNSLTWVEIANVLTVGNSHRLTLFRALGAAPSAGAVTITATAATGCAWSVAEFDGIDTSGTNGSGAIVQSVTGSGSSTALLATLAGFADAVNNAAYGGFGWALNAATATPGSGFTELGEGGADIDRAQSEWKLGEDTSVDATLTISSTWAAIAVEIKAAAAAAARGGRLSLLGGGR